MSNPQKDPNFGNGQVGGDNSWTGPVHGTTADGKPVTVSFGQGNRTGHTGIADGHVSGQQYYAPKNGHDHYGPKGEVHGDRGKNNG